jgi:hypothetical protein
MGKHKISRLVKITDKASVMQLVNVTERVMPDGRLGECWEWQGRLDKNGYGRKGSCLAHRVVYEALVGKIHEGLTLDHLCRNHPCVNPEHLEPVTGKVNTLRGESFSAVNARKEFCKNGHPLNEANTYKRPGGWRGCRRCNQAANKTYRERRAERSAA